MARDRKNNDQIQLENESKSSTGMYKIVRKKDHKIEGATRHIFPFSNTTIICNNVLKGLILWNFEKQEQVLVLDSGKIPDYDMLNLDPYYFFSLTPELSCYHQDGNTIIINSVSLAIAHKIPGELKVYCMLDEQSILIDSSGWQNSRYAVSIYNLVTQKIEDTLKVSAPIYHIKRRNNFHFIASSSSQIHILSYMNEKLGIINTKVFNEKVDEVDKIFTLPEERLVSFHFRRNEDDYSEVRVWNSSIDKFQSKIMNNYISNAFLLPDNKTLVAFNTSKSGSGKDLVTWIDTKTLHMKV